MRFAYSTILLLFLLKNAFGQDSVRVIRLYENNKPVTAVDSFYHKIPNTIWISLDDGFKDSAYITVNGVPFFNKYVETDESIGYAGGFGIDFEDSTRAMVMKIKFVKANFYIQEIINVKYKSLRVWHDGGRGWTLFYDNRFPMRE